MTDTSPTLYEGYHDWKNWDAFFTTTADQAGYFRRELSGLRIRDADVLEIGFGTGSCVAWMAARGARVSVTELSERSREAARKAGYGVLDADLPSSAAAHAGAFDTIIAFDVFEHLPIDEVQRYLDSCATLLRPGGRLLLRFPNAQSPFGLKPQMGDPTHRSFLSADAMRLLLVGRPLRIARYGGSYLYRGRPFSPVWVKRSARRLSQKLIAGLLRFTFATAIPYEPVVVLVLARDGAAQA